VRPIEREKIQNRLSNFQSLGRFVDRVFVFRRPKYNFHPLGEGASLTRGHCDPTRPFLIGLFLIRHALPILSYLGRIPGIACQWTLQGFGVQVVLRFHLLLISRLFEKRCSSRIIFPFFLLRFLLLVSLTSRTVVIYECLVLIRCNSVPFRPCPKYNWAIGSP
jgi:hypothetical protein